MNVVLRAQLEAQTDPDLALATLDKIDMKKVPAMALDQVRGLKAQLLLLNGRLDEAKSLCADIQPSKAQEAASRGMLAATVAETWARTGRAKEAREMLSTISPDDTAYAQSRVPLLFARVFANFAETKHGLVKKDLTAIAKENVNLLGRFLDPRFKTAPELMRLAQEIVMADPEMQKMARKMGGGGGDGRQRRARSHPRARPPSLLPHSLPPVVRAPLHQDMGVYSPLASPSGWQAWSQVSWNLAHTSHPVNLHAVLHDPASARAIEYWPIVSLCWVDPDYGLIQPNEARLGQIALPRCPRSTSWRGGSCRRFAGASRVLPCSVSMPAPRSSSASGVQAGYPGPIGHVASGTLRDRPPPPGEPPRRSYLAPPLPDSPAQHRPARKLRTSASPSPREHRLGVELHPHHRPLPVPQRHHHALVRLGAHLQARGHRPSRHHQRVVPRRHQRITDSRKDPAAVVAHRPRAAVHRLRRALHPRAPRRRDALMSEAHAQHRRPPRGDRGRRSRPPARDRPAPARSPRATAPRTTARRVCGRRCAPRAPRPRGPRRGR